MVDGRREQRHLGVYTPTSAPVSDQEEGPRGLGSRPAASELQRAARGSVPFGRRSSLRSEPGLYKHLRRELRTPRGSV